MTKGDHFDQVFKELRKTGFLLESDPNLPSVCSLIAGEPMRGSWWSHPMAQTIFQVNEKLDDHPDVVITKLVSGKVTFVHQKLWAELFAIGISREAWQMNRLSASAQKLLAAIDEAGSLRTDEIKTLISKPGDVARELERRLLIYSEQFHTTTGAHAKLLETWKHWSDRKNFDCPTMSTVDAKLRFEERLEKLNLKYTGTGRLPWSSD